MNTTEIILLIESVFLFIGIMFIIKQALTIDVLKSQNHNLHIDIDTLQNAVDEYKPYADALIDAATTHWVNHWQRDPKTLLNDLITTNMDIALDPAVSEEARQLLTQAPNTQEHPDDPKYLEVTYTLAGKSRTFTIPKTQTEFFALAEVDPKDFEIEELTINLPSSLFDQYKAMMNDLKGEEE